jgi:hypothetical protein
MNTQHAKEELDQTFGELYQVLSKIAEADINRIPFEGSWTAGQVAQHIILSAGGFVEMLNGPVEDTQRDPEANVAEIRHIFLDFGTKMQSPEFVVPEEKNYDKQELLTSIERIGNGLAEATATLDPYKTCLGFEFPNMGHLTRAESITFVTTHTQRHLHQLKKIAERL